MPFPCTVLTPERIAFEGEIESAVLPAHNGEMGVLPGHADFLGALGTGTARLRKAGGEQVFVLNGGYLRVSKGRLTVLAEEAAAKDEIIREKVEQALKEALAERPKDAAAASERDSKLAWARARLRALG